MPKNRTWTIKDLLSVLGHIPRGLPVTILWSATDDTGPHDTFQIIEYKDGVEILIGYADSNSVLEIL